MKEKFKKLFTSKDLWSYIFEILCGTILFCVGYFSGFANGLLIEDDIRDNMIVEINDLIDVDKKEKLDIEIDKKNAVQLPYTNSITFNDINKYVGVFLNGFDSIHNLQCSYDITFNYTISSYDLITFTNIYLHDLKIIDFEFGDNYEVLDVSIVASSNDIFVLNFFDADDYFSFTYGDSVSFSELFIDNTFTFSLNFKHNLDTYVSTFNDELLTTFSSFNDITLNYISSINDDDATLIFNSVTFISYFVNFDNVNYYNISNSFNFNILTIYGDYQYNNGYFNGELNAGASQEELQQAWQTGFDIGYGSGVIEGVAEYKTSQEYKDELKEEYDKGIDDGYDIGYQARQDSVEDNEQTINSIWSILEKAITSVLNVLSFEIMPGIPLYVCIVVPILLCILLWVIKVGAS